MISIYTHTNNPLKKEFWKYIAKKTINKYSGPDAVLDSLKRGLTELNVPFEVNPLKPKYDTVHVLSGIEVLKEMINKKSCRKIKKLIIGPNLVTNPHDNNNIISNSNIDIILLPSEWTRIFYINLLPEISDHTYIWPAGTNTNNIYINKNKSKCIIYKKDVDINIYNTVIEELKQRNIDYKLIEYGKYKHKNYLDILNKEANYMIYLQKVESQGLSLQEAWARNVATLVWNPESFTYPDGQTVYGKISAPYLTDESGLFFKDKFDFKNKFNLFLKNINTFKPREYCIKKLSDKISSEEYIKIITK